MISMDLKQHILHLYRVDSGIVTAKLDEQKTEETKAKIALIVKNL